MPETDEIKARKERVRFSLGLVLVVIVLFFIVALVLAWRL
jgi:hypothetical protein